MCPPASENCAVKPEANPGGPRASRGSIYTLVAMLAIFILPLAGPLELKAQYSDPTVEADRLDPNFMGP